MWRNPITSFLSQMVSTCWEGKVHWFMNPRVSTPTRHVKMKPHSKGSPPQVECVPWTRCDQHPPNGFVSRIQFLTKKTGLGGPREQWPKPGLFCLYGRLSYPVIYIYMGNQQVRHYKDPKILPTGMVKLYSKGYEVLHSPENGWVEDYRSFLLGR